MIEVGKEASQGKRDDGGDGQVKRRLKPPGLSDLPREVLYLVYCTCTASIPNNKTASAPLPQLDFFLPAFVFIFIKHLLLSIDSYHLVSIRCCDSSYCSTSQPHDSYITISLPSKSAVHKYEVLRILASLPAERTFITWRFRRPRVLLAEPDLSSQGTQFPHQPHRPPSFHHPASSETKTTSQ